MKSVESESFGSQVDEGRDGIQGHRQESRALRMLSVVTIGGSLAPYQIISVLVM